MKLTRKTSRRAIGGAAALAAILMTAASAQSPSWPTPPAPQAGSPAAPEAQSPATTQDKPASQLSPARLGQMLAPIALYPDDLLADILVAATYPLDVVEAARWVQDPQNAVLKGDRLFAALKQKSWEASVKALASFPRILRMLDANLEWTEQLGEANLADPAAVMAAVQRLRHRAQSGGRLVTTSQEVVRTEPEPSRVEEPITIEAPGPEVVYVPICDPSFAYGAWPYPDFPPFFPLFPGATINGCGWISGPIIAPFILNFRARRIEIDHKRLALFDRDRDKERDRDRAPVEAWRHDPGHRGNVPYRDAAVGAMFGAGTPSANLNPAPRGRWMNPPRVEAPFAAAPPQTWSRPGIAGVQPPLDGGRRWRGGIGPPLEGGRAPIAGVQPRSQGAQPALEGVDPTWERASAGQSLDADAERRVLIERGLFGRVPATALAPASGGLRAPPSFGGAGSSRSLGARRFFRPLVGVGAPALGARGPGAIGVQPFNGQGPQMPPGGMGAGGSVRGGH